MGPATRSRRALLALSLCLLCSLSIVVPAATAAADAPLFLVDSTFDGLLTRVYAVDPDSGAMTLHADLGTSWTPVLGMAAASERVLYLTASDNSGLDRCQGGRSCILLRVVLDPDSVASASIEEIGVIRTSSETVTQIVGLTFAADGRLYASSQLTEALYVIDPTTAQAEMIGPFGLDLDGGDITTDGDGRLLLWNSLGDQAGLYDVDPLTGEATVFELHPGLGFAGMAALGHSNRILGASPPSDLLYEIDSVVGLKRAAALLTLDGSRFDHKRGDLDSPFCSDDGACDDGDLCTSDRCSPGGCRAEPVESDDGDACTIDTCDPTSGPVHLDLRLIDSDGDGVDDCADTCPGTVGSQPVDVRGCSVDQLCPCDSGWTNHGSYVSCVASVVERTGESGSRVSRAARSSCGHDGRRWSSGVGRLKRGALSVSSVPR